MAVSSIEKAASFLVTAEWLLHSLALPRGPLYTPIFAHDPKGLPLSLGVYTTILLYE